jgi:hypothetical protein
MVPFPCKRERNRRVGRGGCLLQPIGDDFFVNLHTASSSYCRHLVFAAETAAADRSNSEPISDKIATISGAVSAIFATICNLIRRQLHEQAEVHKA